MNYTLSVSYTHLDVYKRQAIDGNIVDELNNTSGLKRGIRLLQAAEGIFKETTIQARTVIAVSYTHLDVYKRQILFSSSFNVIVKRKFTILKDNEPYVRDAMEQIKYNLSLIFCFLHRNPYLCPVKKKI